MHEQNKHFFCKHCGVEISKESNDKAISENWLPLCDKCDSEIKQKFLEWKPIFDKFKF